MTDEETTQLAINVWGIGTAERTPEKIRLRAGPSGSGCKRIAREELAWARVGLRISNVTKNGL
jgi:hypothetical protein